MLMIKHRFGIRKSFGRIRVGVSDPVVSHWRGFGELFGGHADLQREMPTGQGLN